MPSRPCYRVVLAKEDFKFSAAHFTLWSGGGGELLHGHNYQVKVELAGGELDDAGLLVDLEQCKRVIRGLCGRCYVFPAADTLLLPLINTSIELLARMLWHELAAALRGSRVETLAVAGEGSAGAGRWV